MTICCVVVRPTHTVYYSSPIQFRQHDAIICVAWSAAARRCWVSKPPKTTKESEASKKKTRRRFQCGIRTAKLPWRNEKQVLHTVLPWVTGGAVGTTPTSRGSWQAEMCVEMCQKKRSNGRETRECEWGCVKLRPGWRKIATCKTGQLLRGG